MTFTGPAGWKVLTSDSGAGDHTTAQVSADDSDEPRVFVPAKKVAVSSPSVSPSASPSPSSAGPGLPATGDNSADPGLPVTGADTMLLVGAAAVAVAVGVGLVLVARRRRVRLIYRTRLSGQRPTRGSALRSGEQAKRRGFSIPLESRRPAGWDNASNMRSGRAEPPAWAASYPAGTRRDRADDNPSINQPGHQKLLAM
ncbi:LPXTG cell wall anchor domain-containing protein [Micromonospora sp. NPDC051141]|uniref:LPXTG cell wall anchor domain-containing protein n=1 Tax=Micromonospora sp. NPDC051141 TaxID=3364284 RepID=UPI0037B3E256